MLLIGLAVAAIVLFGSFVNDNSDSTRGEVLQLGMYRRSV
jgi:hypothetical protein